MNDRRYLVWFLISALVWGVMALAVVEAYDPYGENASRIWSDKPRYAVRVLTARRLAAKLEEGPYDIVFGTSRSAMLSRDATDRPTLNFYPVYGNPRMVMDVLEHLGPRQAGHVGTIYYALDLPTFCESCGVEDTRWRSDIWTAVYKLAHLPEAVSRLPLDVVRNLRGNTGTWVDNGAVLDLRPESGNGAWLDRGAVAPMVMPVEDATLDRLAVLDRLIRQKGWRVEYFTPPLPVATLAVSDRAVLADLKRRLLERIPQLHDLTYLPGVSENPRLFADATHLNPRGGRAAICAIRSRLYLVGAENSVSQDPALGHPVNRPPLPEDCLTSPPERTP
ncbi:hypothetical protein CCC_00798 [Paramagnetospirillum magnetotacticum MS-1]|uniref:Uncharacterized protein n=1 Tax=Paramagnetospirillum magnetotacticum MS-1 TaxID=272627 RepID=A0A0C2U8B2_PARME|nr:hypothetical protein [Paramagnetospirillum magnetotacticum]KIL97737.1 hypothetical protein CCC_00798 [Paramagnetospirillum magnetotacticum MS-1]